MKKYFLVILFFIVFFAFVSSAKAAAPADLNATANAKALLNYLTNLPNRSDTKVISGEFLGGMLTFSNTDETIYQQTGKYIGLIGVDYHDYSGDQYDFSAVNAKLKDFWNKGGLVQVMVFYNNPISGGCCCSFCTEPEPSIDLDAIVTPGTDLNTSWNKELDRLATGFADLQNSGVVVLFNAFSEMNGGRWWTTSNYDQFKKLWIYTFNYLTQTKNIHNLLWVFAPGWWTGDSTMDWYPGDQYVDIVGYSYYDDNPFVGSLNLYNLMVATHKPFALTEFGPCGGDGSNCSANSRDYSQLIAGIKQNVPNAVYWMSWRSYGDPTKSNWSMSTQNNVTQLLDDPWVITRDKINFGGSSSVCGNGICDSGETCSSCPSDCCPAPTLPGWTFCANENQTCSFNGTKLVQYGANSQYYTQTLTDGTLCANSVFGDPIVGTAKYCYYRDVISTKKGDLNNDGKVDISDLGILLSNWGSTSKPTADINQDGYVNVTDLGILLSNWG